MSSALRSALPVVALVALSAIGILVVQPALAESTHRVRQRDDAFLLPPAQQLRAMSLGHHAAAADLGQWDRAALECDEGEPGVPRPVV